MKSLKAEYLKQRIEHYICYPSIVWFSETAPHGWLFKTDQTFVKRLGTNYKQALNYVENFDWFWIMKRLSKDR